MKTILSILLFGCFVMLFLSCDKSDPESVIDSKNNPMEIDPASGGKILEGIICDGEGSCYDLNNDGIDDFRKWIYSGQAHGAWYRGIRLHTLNDSAYFLLQSNPIVKYTTTDSTIYNIDSPDTTQTLITINESCHPLTGPNLTTDTLDYGNVIWSETFIQPLSIQSTSWSNSDIHIIFKRPRECDYEVLIFDVPGVYTCVNFSDDCAGLDAIEDAYFYLKVINKDGTETLGAMNKAGIEYIRLN